MYTDNKRGVVLISVLLIVLILSGISVSLGEIFFKSIKRSTYIEFQSTSIQLQRNMESLGIDLIDQNLRYNKGYLTKNDQLLKDEIFFESNGFLIRSRLVDTSNCFNLNSLLISFQNASSSCIFLFSKECLFFCRCSSIFCEFHKFP